MSLDDHSIEATRKRTERVEVGIRRQARQVLGPYAQKLGLWQVRLAYQAGLLTASSSMQRRLAALDELVVIHDEVVAARREMQAAVAGLELGSYGVDVIRAFERLEQQLATHRADAEPRAQL